MRLLALLALGAFSAFSQPFTFGVKGGVPLTDLLKGSAPAVHFNAIANTNRYIVGPTIELHLPANFAVEFDALFRHFSYQTAVTFIANYTTNTATSNAWEFPLLLKYRLPAKFVRPYIDGGVAWDRLQGLSATLTHITPGGSTTTETSSPQELQNATSTGVVIGGGVDIHALFLHISPEVRYTRWTSQHFTFADVLTSSQNQAEFLLGITF